MGKFLYFGILFAMVACTTNNPNIVEDFPKDQKLERKQRAGNMFGNKEGIIVFQDKSSTENIDTVKDLNLWERSIRVVSGLIPISTSDEKLGLITTEWGNISNLSGNNDPYKINIVVSGNKVKKENIKISVFREVNKGVADRDHAMENKIEDAIINYGAQ